MAKMKGWGGGFFASLRLLEIYVDTPFKDNEEKIEAAQQEDFPTTMASSPDSMSRVEVFLI